MTDFADLIATDPAFRRAANHALRSQGADQIPADPLANPHDHGKDSEMSTATVTRRSRNLGINATAYANSGPHGWHFAPLTAPEETGGCATIRRELASYRRMWGPHTYYRVDLFVGGRRVAKDTGDYEKLRDFCLDAHDRYDDAVTVFLED